MGGGNLMIGWVDGVFDEWVVWFEGEKRLCLM